MALTFRTPMEDIVASFEPALQSTISSKAALAYKSMEEENFNVFNFHLNANAKQKLSNAGIYLSPYSAVSHSHPVCKTLENYLLYSVLPSYINNKFFFVGIKSSKLQLLKSRDQKVDLVVAINRFVTSKDKARYSNDFVIRSSKPHKSLQRHQLSLNSATLKDLVPELLIRGAKNLFLHDELHYWSKEELVTFLEVLEPDILIGTIVSPPELLIGAKKSLNPWCYEFDIKGKTLLFYPDGVRTEGYEQPVNGGYLLRTNSIILPNGITYKVDLLCSRFAHHLVCISKGSCLGVKYRSFSGFEAVGTEQLQDVISNDVPFIPVCFDVVSRIYRYLKSLKKPDLQSAMAKLSQIVPNPSADEIKFVYEFSDLVINTESTKSLICPERCKIFYGKVISGVLPQFLKDKFQTIREVSLDNFVANLRPLSFTLPLVEIKSSLNPLEVPTIDDPSICATTIDNLDFGTPKITEVAFMLARSARPYSYKCVPSEPIKEPLLHVNAPELLDLLKRHLLRSFPNLCASGLDRTFIKEFLTISFRNTMLLHVSAVSTLKVNGSFFITALMKRTRSHAQRFQKCWFYEVGISWFSSYIRGYTKFLDSTCASGSFYPQFMERWNLVCVDACKLAQEKSRVYIHSKDDLSMGREEDEYPKVERVTQRNAPEVSSAIADELISGGQCSECGISITQKRAIYPDGNQFLSFLSGVDNKVQISSTNSELSSRLSSKYGFVNCAWPHWLNDWKAINEIDPSFDIALLCSCSNADCVESDHIEEGNEDLCGSRCLIGLKGAGFFNFKNKDCVHTIDILEGIRFDYQVNSLKVPKPIFYHDGVCSTLTFYRSKIEKSSQRAQSPIEVNEKSHSIVSMETTAEVIEREIDNTNVPKFDSKLSGCLLDGGMGEMKVNSNVVVEDVRKLMVRAFVLSKEIECEHFEELARYNTIQTALLDICHLETSLHSKALGLTQDSINFTEKFEVGVLELINSDHVNIINLVMNFCYQYNLLVNLVLQINKCIVVVNNSSQNLRTRNVGFLYIPESYSSGPILKILPKNLCVLKALAELLTRDVNDLFSALQNKEHEDLFKSLIGGSGVVIEEVEQLCRIFSICASIETPAGLVILNEGGTIPGFFLLENDHLTLRGYEKDQGFSHFRHLDLEAQFTENTLNYLSLQGTMIKYQLSLPRAKILAESFRSGNTGITLSEVFNNHPNMQNLFINGLNQDYFVDLLCILGTFGAGKSRLFVNIGKKAKGRKFHYVSPRSALLADMKRTLKIGATKRERKLQGQENWKFCTFETFLKQVPFLSEGQLVFIDEIQLYPPGYVDLILAMALPGVKFVLLGDPCQSDYDNEKDRVLLESIPSCVDSLLIGKEYRYNILSHRFQNRNFDNRLPCNFPSDEFKLEEEYIIREGLDYLKDVDEMYKSVVLVSSFDEKKVIESYMGRDVNVITFGESTGLTFDYGILVITLISARANERRWLTALSRFRKNLIIFNCTGYTLDNLLLQYKNRALHKFLTGSSTRDQIQDLLPGKPEFCLGFKDPIGRDEGIREEKMMGDPWLKSMIDLFQLEDTQEEVIQAVEQASETFKVHLPREDLEGTRARWVHKLLAKEFREVRIGHLVSDQFTDDHSKQRGGALLTNAAERFEAIYPRHRANDTVTFLMAVKKRLSFSKPHIEKAKLWQAKPFGRFLLQTFLKYVPIKRQHDQYKMEKARQDFFDKRVSKSAAAIENHSYRSSRDWLVDIGQIFSKSQLCTKFDNRFRLAKAAQSILCFQHSVLCRFAPFMRYIEMKFQEALPDKFYIHSGKGFDELNEWVIKHKFDGVCTESDYEAFDSSQDQYIMAFELELMKYLGIPNDLIHDYEYIKTHLGSKLGSFAIMRFTGEASTFLFNTMANMLFTFLRYELKGNESICFAGDDMCSSKRLVKSKQHEKFLSKIALKAKVQHTSTPTFCGWHLCADGIYKKPQLVLERMCIARELNNLHNCIDNYAIEISYAYRLGEKITGRMNEEEIGAYYGCVRTIIKNKHLLKSDIKELYSNVEM